MGLIGLSPRHSNRPPLAVLLKRMNRLVLAPVTLDHQRRPSRHEAQSREKKCWRDEINGVVCTVLTPNLAFMTQQGQ